MSSEELTLDDGVVYRNGQPVQAVDLKLILDDRRKQGCLSSAVAELLQSRRPALLMYSFSVDDKVVVSVSHRKMQLTESHTKSAIDLGYFIELGRVNYLSELDRERLERAIQKPTTANLIRLMRDLKVSGRLDSAPENVLHQLAQKGKPKASRSNIFEKQLYPYQVTGVDWLKFCTQNGIGTILADDMGLGKTAQVIALICNIIEVEPESNILIVVPNPLLENWRREFSFFAPSLTPYIHYGVGRTGLGSDLAEHAVVITPYTTMTQDISMLSEVQFQLTLFDEASMVKNPKSARTLASCAINSEVKIAMTGTPVENSLNDAWSLSELVFPGYLDDAETFSNRYINNEIEVVLEKNLEELETSLRQITIRRLKTDVLKQLPEKQDIHIPVLMSDQERQSYDQIIQQLKSEAEEGVRNILPMILRLQQFTAHPAILDDTIDTSVKGLIKSSGKFELLISRLDQINNNGEKVLIFATFHKAIDLIVDAIAARYGVSAGKIDGRTPNAERQLLIDAFSATEGFDVLVLHPKTAGMGLNITAASHVIHYSRQWNPALEQQATARAWRNGQENIVMAYYFFYADTIEETVDQRLRLKQQLSDKVVSITEDKESDKQMMLDYLVKGNAQ